MVQIGTEQSLVCANTKVFGCVELINCKYSSYDIRIFYVPVSTVYLLLPYQGTYRTRGTYAQWENNPKNPLPFFITSSFPMANLISRKKSRCGKGERSQQQQRTKTSIAFAIFRCCSVTVPYKNIYEVRKKAVNCFSIPSFEFLLVVIRQTKQEKKRRQITNQNRKRATKTNRLLKK